MKKRSFTLLLSALTISATLIGTTPVLAATDTDTVTEESSDASKSDTLEDGIYTAEFDTDSGMFHVNEANDGKGTLTVKDGKMNIHVSLASKKIVNLFAGKAEDAEKDGAEILEPTTDTVTYSDGISEEVYGFDIPVPSIDEEFDVALIGTKGKWYDHKVSVKNPVKTEDIADTDADNKGTKDADAKELADLGLEDGDYTMEVTLSGGSGKATVESPAAIKIESDKATATIVWSSPNYDYMLVDGEKYEPVNKEGNSVFEIPVSVFDAEMDITADTVAMSEPHEIDYTLKFDSATVKEAEKKDISGLTYDHSMELSYAEEFTVDYYNDGYALITIDQEGQFLVVPEGKEAPKDLDKEIKVIQQPLNNIYLVATSAMDLFRAIGGIDSIRLSGTQENGWYIQEAKDAMESGKMIYAGKYNAPDYELILSEGCGLAVESTMIEHNPEVKEKLEQFGIPVLVERSSYESHPLGRTEWMKLYAVLLGKEDEAEKAFKEQTDKLDKVLTSDDIDTGKTVAFFYINSTGAVNVRKNNDYVSKMIELAGGTYVPEDTGESDNALSTMNMQMEEFYAKAKDADYIIYNSTIDGELSAVDELLAKSNLLADFKAVKNGSVWCTGKNLFQETTELGTMIEDIHTILTTEDDSLDELNYMHRLK